MDLGLSVRINWVSGSLGDGQGVLVVIGELAEPVVFFSGLQGTNAQNETAGCALVDLVER